MCCLFITWFSCVIKLKSLYCHQWCFLKFALSGHSHKAQAFSMFSAEMLMQTSKSENFYFGDRSFILKGRIRPNRLPFAADTPRGCLPDERQQHLRVSTDLMWRIWLHKRDLKNMLVRCLLSCNLLSLSALVARSRANGEDAAVAKERGTSSLS